jgi:hypothetical protein
LAQPGGNVTGLAKWKIPVFIDFSFQAAVIVS